MYKKIVKGKYAVFKGLGNMRNITIEALKLTKASHRR